MSFSMCRLFTGDMIPFSMCRLFTGDMMSFSMCRLFTGDMMRPEVGHKHHNSAGPYSESI